MSIRSTNRDHYNEAYNTISVLKCFLKVILSYDQVSKAKRNICMIKKVPCYKIECNILDYGFGYGSTLLRLPRRHVLSGRELSKEAITNINKLSRYLARRVTTSLASDYNISKDREKYDLVICSHVLEHVEDDKDLLIYFNTLLTKSGYLLLNLPINEVIDDPRHFRSYNKKTVISLLNNSGYKVQNIYECDRLTGWILYHEYLSRVKMKFIFRLIRLICAMFPIFILDTLDKILSRKYQNQQLIILAIKL